MRPVLPRDGLTILFYSHTVSVWKEKKERKKQNNRRKETTKENTKRKGRILHRRNAPSSKISCGRGFSIFLLPFFILLPEKKRKKKTTFCVKQNWTLTTPQFLLVEGRVKKNAANVYLSLFIEEDMATLLVIGYSTLFIIIIIIIIKLFSGPWYVLPLSSLSFVCATKLRDRIENQYFDGGSSILSLHPTHTHPAPSSSSTRANGESNEDWARPSAPGACCHRSRREQTNQEIYYFIQSWSIMLGNCRDLVHTLCPTFV